MMIAHIDNSTRTLGAPKDMEDCSPLAIRDVMTPVGPCMVSAWEPTPSELKALQEGATVKLMIYGLVHPVVSLCVGDVEAPA